MRNELQKIVMVLINYDFYVTKLENNSISVMQPGVDVNPDEICNILLNSDTTAEFEVKPIYGLDGKKVEVTL